MIRLAPTHHYVILCCTHTHSAPATVKLIGCGIPNPRYWQRVVAEAHAAAKGALASLQPATLQYATETVRGVSYNRRAVLADGRVVMAQFPDAPVVKAGPTLERMVLARFAGDDGHPIAGIVNWAAHACVMCTPEISADYPGELRRRLARANDVPFVFLQGACGNINLPLGDNTRRDVLSDVDAIASQLHDIHWSPSIAVESVEVRDAVVPLAYERPPSQAELAAWAAGMDEIARTGTGPEHETRILADILNVPPGQWPDPAMLRHITTSLSQWARELSRAGSGVPDYADLRVRTLALGPLVFCFVAAEVFAETALAIQEAFPGLIVALVGYGSPLLGYLPTDEALDEGGYETDHAYRFYGHPAPYARGSEEALLVSLAESIAALPQPRA